MATLSKQKEHFNGRLVMNKCKQCGSTSYKPIIRRDQKGVMRPSGQYQCTGCNLVFTTVDEWRNGEAFHNSAEQTLLDQPQNHNRLS